MGPSQSALLEELPARSTRVDGSRTEPRFTDEIALLNKKKLYKMFGFFPNPKSLPKKSLRCVQIGASKSLLNCLLYNVYIHFTLKKKKGKMQTLTF